MGDPFAVQVFVKGASGKVLEQPREVVFAETDQPGNIVECHILGAVFRDVLAHKDKLCRIFLLFGVRDLRTDPLAGVFASDEDEHFEQACVNHGTGEHIAAEIFLLDLHHQCEQFIVDIRRVLLCDVHDRRDAREHRLDLRDILQHRKIGLKDQPLALTGIHAVQDTGVDKEKITFLQPVCLTLARDIISVSDRYDDLDRRVPVRGVGFVIMIVEQHKACDLFVIDSLLDALKRLNHSLCSFPNVSKIATISKIHSSSIKNLAIYYAYHITKKEKINAESDIFMSGICKKFDKKEKMHKNYMRVIVKNRQKAYNNN